MNKLIHISFISIFLLASFGCATSRTNIQIPLKSEIDKTKIIYVMQAKDGAYGDIKYNGSGLNVSRRILSILRKVQPLAQLVEETNETDAAKNAKEKGASYLIVPDLLHWEDRATEWSGYRDKVQIELRLLSLDPLDVISSQDYSTTNNSITFLNTKPEDLLDERFEEFIYQFLGK